MKRRNQHMERLRRMLEEQTLLGLLNDLADLCAAKAIHIAEVDERLAREWARATQVVASAAKKIRENQPRERHAYIMGASMRSNA